MKFYLVSSSPRREQILKNAGYEFTTLCPKSQDLTQKLSKFDPVQVLKTARNKLVGFEEKGVYLAADTVVVVDGLLLPKPANESEAIKFLQLLSGKVHKVYTAYVVRKLPGGIEMGKIECTEVKFKEMTRREINWLINSDNPYDKAGGYAIQGKAAVFIEWIKGDYFNVVGLPISSVYETLKSFGVLPSKFGQIPG